MSIAAQVLVVDDEEIAATLLRSALERDGHEVTAVTSPSEALERVTVGNFDVVLTDLAMHELNGFELCERIVAVRPEIPVILVTGHATMQAAVDAMRVGAYDFITKPVEHEVLVLAVNRAIQKRRLSAEVRRLQQDIASTASPDGLGSSAPMRRVHEMVSRIATSTASVLIHGETGTGKELVARALHERSGRTGAFVALNCAAVPSNLLETELFGHARGAYTDARTQRDGLFVEANNGTIFLDEIADLPLDIQPKLLRSLQERTVRPIGSNAEIPFDARLVTATNRDLEEEVREKRFREDLFYRVNVIKVDLPPLRERGGDAVELAAFFVAKLAEKTSRPNLKISAAAAAKLLAYSWPGNVRELENCMERAVVVARFDEIEVADLPEKVRAYQANRFVISADDTNEIVPMIEVERRYFLRVLALVGGNKARAAQLLGVDRRTLYRKLERFGIPLDEFRLASKPPPVSD